MFWYNKIVVELDLIQHHIRFAKSSDARYHLSQQNKSDVALGLIQQVFNVRFVAAHVRPEDRHKRYLRLKARFPSI